MRPPTTDVSSVRSETDSASARPSSFDQNPKFFAFANPLLPAFASSSPIFSNSLIAFWNTGDFMSSQPLAKFEYAAGSVIDGFAAFTALQIFVQIASPNEPTSTVT